ncbi:hypothetical protein KKHLCK_14985 [Candidatus Electrothrix laxa]
MEALPKEDSMNSDHRETQADVSDYLKKLPEEAASRGEDNEQLILRTMGRHNRSMIPTVFNRRERQLVREHLMAELAVGFKHRRQALTLVMETRLHSIRESCNHVLVTGKTSLRQQRLEHFGKIYQQVANQLNVLSDEFLTDVDQRFQKLERYKTQCIRDREQQRLEKSVDDFLDTMDQLLDEFRNIVSENVDHEQVP